MVDFNLGPVGMMPSYGVATMDLGYSMMGAATAMGVPGFGYSSSPFPLIAGMNWSSGSSGYWGTSGFRGVADIAEASNNINRGFPASYGLSGMSGLGGGFGLFGIPAPMVGSGGYYLGPGPGFIDTNAILMAYFNNANASQQSQPAGPAQAAAPQPAAPQGGSQVDAKGDGKASSAAPRRGGRGRTRPPAATPPTAAPGSAPAGSTPAGRPARAWWDPRGWIGL